MGSAAEPQQILHHPQYGGEVLQVQGLPLLLEQQQLLQLEHQVTEQRSDKQAYARNPENTGFLGHSEVTGKKHYWYY